MTQVAINGQAVTVVECDGQRVVTLGMVDALHQRPEGTARRNFNTNKQHLIEGEDYFVRNSYEARELGFTAPNGLTLLTESGYAMLAKSFTDDLAWQVQRQLVQSYFQSSKGGINKAIAPLQAQIASLTEEVRSLVITRPTGVAVCAGMTAKEWLIEYKCEQKGRNPIVRRVSANLRNLAHRQGIALEKCTRTGTWVFPTALARPYMESMGRMIIRKHNDLVLRGQPGLAFPKQKKRKAGAPPFAKKPEPGS